MLAVKLTSYSPQLTLATPQSTGLQGCRIGWFTRSWELRELCAHWWSGSESLNFSMSNVHGNHQLLYHPTSGHVMAWTTSVAQQVVGANNVTHPKLLSMQQVPERTWYCKLVNGCMIGEYGRKTRRLAMRSMMKTQYEEQDLNFLVRQMFHLEGRFFKAKESMRPAKVENTTMRWPVNWRYHKIHKRKVMKHEDLLLLPHMMPSIAATHFLPHRLAQNFEHKTSCSTSRSSLLSRHRGAKPCTWQWKWIWPVERPRFHRWDRDVWWTDNLHHTDIRFTCYVTCESGTRWDSKRKAGSEWQRLMNMSTTYVVSVDCGT